MKPSNKLAEVKLDDLKKRLAKMKTDEGAETFLGALMTTKGILVLLFSARLNKDFPVVVLSTDTSKVLSVVFEELAR